MVIEVPPDTNVVLDYTVGNGAVVDNDTTLASGEALRGNTPIQRSRAGGHTLTLDVEVNRGVVTVQR